MVAKERERLTIIGSLVQTMQAQVLGLSQRLGAQIAAQITGVAQAMAGALGTLFSDLITQPTQALDNLGKNVLGAFGDMALQLSGFFAAEALGMAFTPGGQASAVGLGVAAAALAVIGGTLKGVAASIGAPPRPAAVLGAASGSNISRQGVPGAQPEDKAVRETFVLINGVPWRNQNDTEDFNGFVGWARSGGRRTGKNVQFREI